MKKYWAVIVWNGTHDMADEKFAHVVWSSESTDAAVSRAQEWGRKNLAPATADNSTVTYLGTEGE